MKYAKHLQTAETIRGVHNTFNKLLLDLSKEYGVTSRVTRYVIRCKDKLSELRSILDTELVIEHHKAGHDCGIYYKGDKNDY